VSPILAILEKGRTTV